MNKLTITIQDISEGQGKAFAATIHELNDSIAMADSLTELFEIIQLTIDEAQKNNIGIYSKKLQLTA